MTVWLMLNCCSISVLRMVVRGGGERGGGFCTWVDACVAFCLFRQFRDLVRRSGYSEILELHVQYEGDTCCILVTV